MILNAPEPDFSRNVTSNYSTDLGASISMTGAVTGNVSYTAKGDSTYTFTWGGASKDYILTGNQLPGQAITYFDGLSDAVMKFKDDGDIAGKQLYLIEAAAKATKISVTISGDANNEFKGNFGSSRFVVGKWLKG